VGKSYPIGKYRLASFFATCETKDESILTRSFIEDSSFERSIIDLVVSKPQKKF
jgi:hypothetical protein